MKVVYAMVWKSSASEEEFEQRMPGLMQWLKSLHEKGQLRACGEWLNSTGGLTIVEAASLEEAKKIDQSNPLNEVGSTEIFVWEVFHADLIVEGGL